MLTHSLLQARLILFIVLRAGVIFPFYRKQTLDAEKWRNWLETTQFILWTLSSLWSSQRSWGTLWRKECILRHFSPFPWRTFSSCCPHHHHPPCPGRTCIYCFSIWRGRAKPMHVSLLWPFACEAPNLHPTLREMMGGMSFLHFVLVAGGWCCNAQWLLLTHFTGPQACLPGPAWPNLGSQGPIPRAEENSTETASLINTYGRGLETKTSVPNVVKS